MLELMLAMSISCVLLGALLLTGLFTARGFATMGNYRDLEAKSRNALDKISQDIRQTDYLSNYTTTSLAFQTTDPTTTNKYTLSFTYDTNALTLTRVKSGVETNVLLTNCSYFHFDLFQRNPSLTNGGDLTALLSTNSARNVKAIDFTWICAASISGQTYSSEDVQSARVVIRKE